MKKPLVSNWENLKAETLADPLGKAAYDEVRIRQHLVKAIEDKIDNGMSFEELSVKLDISMFQLNNLLDRIDGPFYLLDAIKIANFCGYRLEMIFDTDDLR